jgi:hypothetical protein
MDMKSRGEVSDLSAKWPLCILAIGAAVAGQAGAAVPDPWGLYIGADAGRTTFNVQSAQVDDLLGTASGSSRLDSNDMGYALVAGFRFTENLAVEASWLDLGRSRYTTSQGDLWMGSRGPMLSGIFNVPLTRSWSLEGRVGMYFGNSHPRGYLTFNLGIGSDGIKIVSLEGAGGADPAGTLGAGLVGSIGRYWTIHIGYEYFIDKTIDVTYAGTDQTLETSGNRAVLGVRYRF